MKYFKNSDRKWIFVFTITVQANPYLKEPISATDFDSNIV